MSWDQDLSSLPAEAAHLAEVIVTTLAAEVAHPNTAETAEQWEAMVRQCPRWSDMAQVGCGFAWIAVRAAAAAVPDARLEPGVLHVGDAPVDEQEDGFRVAQAGALVISAVQDQEWAAARDSVMALGDGRLIAVCTLKLLEFSGALIRSLDRMATVVDDALQRRAAQWN